MDTLQYDNMRPNVRQPHTIYGICTLVPLLRRKLYAAILKKEISKGQKARNFNQKERINNKKRIAVQCMRAVRQKAMMSQRFNKETLSRAKRLTREMQNHWKKHDRIDKQEKRKLEKEVIFLFIRKVNLCGKQ